MRPVSLTPVTREPWPGPAQALSATGRRAAPLATAGPVAPRVQPERALTRRAGTEPAGRQALRAARFRATTVPREAEPVLPEMTASPTEVSPRPAEAPLQWVRLPVAALSPPAAAKSHSIVVRASAPPVLAAQSAATALPAFEAPAFESPSVNALAASQAKPPAVPQPGLRTPQPAAGQFRIRSISAARRGRSSQRS